MNHAVKTRKFGSPPGRVLLVGAQVLSLVTFIFGLEFLKRTTGSTLFLFSTVGFLFALPAAVTVLGVASYHFL
jgi:hypothetical protein